MSFSSSQLLPGETMVLLTHQHGLVLLKPILLTLIAEALIVALYFYLQEPMVLVLLVFPGLFLMWPILVRSRKQYIITNRRVVIQEGVFSVKSYDASLDKINNIFHEQSFGGRILGYGDVGLETASEQGTSVFHFIPKPLVFKNAVIEQREAYKMGSSHPGRSQANIPEMLDQLARLRNEKVITEAEFEQKKKKLLDQI